MNNERRRYLFDLYYWTDSRDGRRWKVRVHWPESQMATREGTPDAPPHGGRRRIEFRAADGLEGPYGTLLDEGDLRELKGFSDAELEELLDQGRG